MTLETLQEAVTACHDDAYSITSQTALTAAVNTWRADAAKATATHALELEQMRQAFWSTWNA